MRRGAAIPFVLLLSVCLVGCAALGEAIRGELEAMSQPSGHSLEVKAAATVVVTPYPTLTPAMTPTSRVRVLPELEPRLESDAGENPAPPAAAPDVQAAQECSILWGLMSAGQALVDEWYAWMAVDPPSPQAHLQRLETLARRWETHAAQAVGTRVSPDTMPIRDAYLEAVRAYWGSALLARDALQRGDQRPGEHAEQMATRANELWFAAYDRIDSLCRVAYASGVALPNLPPARAATATPTPQP